VVILNDATPPGVKGVQFSNTVIHGGATLEYDSGTNSGDAEVSKDGNSYTITGTATGKDVSNPTQQVSKSFQIDVTCP
jgi:lipoprotein LpqH